MIGTPDAARRIGRYGRRNFTVAALLLTVLIVCGALLLWASGRAPYRSVAISAVGTERVAVVSYPDDWLIINSEVEPPLASEVQIPRHITLKRRVSHGLQRWIDACLYRVSDAAWGDAGIQVNLMHIGPIKSLDDEIQRFEPALRQLTRLGGSYSVRKSACPAGPLLDIQYHPAGNGLQVRMDISNMLIVYPGEGDVEIAILYGGPVQLRGAMRRTALDVVSRIRLVKEDVGVLRGHSEARP